jgi:protein-S-isoprenylcysteine O-methyltransferase Ste14
MSHESAYGYGLWSLVLINSVVFILFALSFAKPQSSRDWRSFGAFSAFIVALFVEMYGFPLTIYLLSGWLAQRYPGIDLLSHENGHLFHTLLGWKGDPHFDLFHVLSYVLVGGGFWILAAAWPVLYQAQRERRLATTGPYSRVRHPQYLGFILIMAGFLFQWPTLVTLVMFPILVVMYLRLAQREEAEARADFGAAYEKYARDVPGWIPRLRSPSARGRSTVFPDENQRR